MGVVEEMERAGAKRALSSSPPPPPQSSSPPAQDIPASKRRQRSLHDVLSGSRQSRVPGRRKSRQEVTNSKPERIQHDLDLEQASSPELPPPQPQPQPQQQQRRKLISDDEMLLWQLEMDGGFTYGEAMDDDEDRDEGSLMGYEGEFVECIFMKVN